MKIKFAISIIAGTYFLYLSFKILYATGFSLFYYDDSPLYAYRWSDKFSEFILSVVIGFGFLANGWWQACLLWRNEKK
ncbi:hypothetical protein [Desulfogranum japonicum]|uniref:hypothetical protein n=1 Tax=Desulfogranum japonicum TaxID=231447 RepID=UPI0004240285|nr:hypothetical protein [Desulfogranum japonicum]